MIWVPGIDHVSPADIAALEKAAKKAGLSFGDLCLHISQESGFNPRVRVGKNSGLIMMSDDTSRAFNGGKLADSLSFQAQIPGIIRYFSIGKPISGADFRLLGIRRGENGKPRLIDVANTYIIFAENTSGWKANPSLRSANNGPITVGSVRKAWAAYEEKYAGKPQKHQWVEKVWERFPPTGGGGGFVVPAIAIGSFGFWLWRKLG